MNIAPTADDAPDFSGGMSGARLALWHMLAQACNAAALAHLLFLLLFAMLGLPLLMLVNVASVALFIGSRALLQRHRSNAAVSLMVGEVLLHASVASRLLGWDSGFHYYLITLIGPLALVMNGSTAGKVARLLMLGVGYAVLDAWTRHVQPTYRLAPAILASIRYFNMGGMLVIIAFVSLSYYRLVASAEYALRTLASTDPLTGLHNRRRLLEIARATREAGQEVPGLFLLLCDIDHFKQVNDHHGHEVGDLVLERVAGAVTAAVRTTDSVARWGGEEFVVLLPGADFDSAVQTGDRIRHAVAALATRSVQQSSPLTALAAPDLPVPVTMTIGVARVDPAETIDAVIARADAALYRGKAAGRDRVVVADDMVPSSFNASTDARGSVSGWSLPSNL